MFYSKDDSVYLLLYVVDILICTRDVNIIGKLTDQLLNRFKGRNLGKIKFFLGLNIDYDNVKRTIVIDQKELIDKIAVKFNVVSCNPIYTPIEERLNISIADLKNDNANLSNYKILLRSLMYIMLGKRPDVCYTISYFAQF